jgi:hypothetical protein
MSRFHLAALTLPALCLGLASSAIAKLPDPANCEVPDHIVLVACGADGSADPLGTFTLHLVDYGGGPVSYANVALDFHACPDIRICNHQGDPNVSTDCTYRTVRAFTDMDGRVTFQVIGCATHSGAGSVTPSLDVYADGVFLKSVRVSALDQNGVAGADSGDLALFLTDYFSGQPFARSDYDGSGALGAADLSYWLGAFFAGRSVVSAATCP